MASFHSFLSVEFCGIEKPTLLSKYWNYPNGSLKNEFVSVNREEEKTICMETDVVVDF